MSSLNYLEYELLLNREFLDVLSGLIDRSRKRVYVASYVSTLSKKLKNIYYGLAYKQLREGVDVKVFLNGVSGEAVKHNVPTVEFLRGLGMKNVKLSSKYTHIKLYIIDDYFIIGSHNLSYSSESMNSYEASIMMKSKAMSDKLAEFFNEVFLTEAAEPMFFRDVLENGVYYEIMANTKIISDLYAKTSYAVDRVKILMYVASLSKSIKKYYALLKRKQDEGVDVAVVLNGAFKVSSTYNSRVRDYLKKIGVERVLLTRRFVHAKLAILDDFVVIGSHNLTASSVAGRMELTVAIKARNLSNSLNLAFERLYDEENQLNRLNTS
ncbi:MAG: phospholipase D-like domain-containing protein [Sulfolobales archaeon]